MSLPEPQSHPSPEHDTLDNVGNEIGPFHMACDSLPDDSAVGTRIERRGREWQVAALPRNGTSPVKNSAQ